MESSKDEGVFEMMALVVLGVLVLVVELTIRYGFDPRSRIRTPWARPMDDLHALGRALSSRGVRFHH
jgi:hypothetical protein